MAVRSAFRLVELGAVLVFQIGAQERELREAARLDAEQRCNEAEGYYRKALATAPESLAVWNNLGNHYLTCGAPEKARASFERVLKINSAHPNANLQLARLATERKEGAKALEYLSRLDNKAPEVLLVRAEALHQTGKREAAIAVIDGLAKSAGGDPSLLFGLGITCGRMGLYEQAEMAFAAVLARSPDDFDVLYNLGLSAARAEHYDRARRAFEVALKVRPQDLDSLYQLGRVQTELEDYPRAVYLLAQARKRAPQRPDVILALARAAQMAGYYGDCILAYDDYLRLQPEDDMVRRDRALVYGFTRAGLEEGLRDLTRYVGKHPDDAVGFYDLAQLLDRVDRPRALAQVSTAVRLNPELEPARHFRATLLEKLGRNEESIADLQAVLRLNPRNFRALDLLGLNYLDLDKPAEAEKALGRAVALAPDEPDVLFHLGRSLMELGRGAEAQQFLDRFQKLRKDRAGTSVPREEPGIIEAASLTPAERSRRIVAQLQQFAREKPGDPSLKMNLGSALLAEGRIEEAAATFRELLALNPGSAISHRAGTTLLRFEQYALARDFLQRAATEMPAARLDLAMALFFTDGPERALKVLEQVPEGQEAGDYLLMKATILDAAGQIAEAERVLERSLDRSISRPRLAQEAALLLVRHNHPAKALELIGRALKAAPDDASIMLTRVVVLGSMGRNNEAEKAVKEIEKRWPEWYRPYLVEGLLMERESRVEGARQRIQIALALGAQEPAARCALARMAAAPPEPRCSCQPGIYEPFFPECRNP